METAKLLQDITFYTRIIRERTKQNEKLAQTIPVSRARYTNTWHRKVYNTTNDYKYIKRKEPNVVPEINVKLPVLNPTKVHINPHFKPACVHINPNFKSNFMQKTCHKVHINPKVINCDQNSMVIPKPVINSVPQSVHIPSPQVIKKLEENKIIQKTKYKIVKKVVPIIASTPLRKSVVRTRYKLDRRDTSVRRRKLTPILKKSPKAIVKSSKNLFMKLCNIDGITYRSSRNKLQKTSSIQRILKTSDKSLKKSHQRSYRYVKQTEVKMKTRNRIRRISVVHSSKYKLIKKKLTTKQKSPCDLKKMSRLLRSRKLVKASSKYRKNNVPCPIYRRYGKCSSHEKGTCRRLHDSKLIDICKKYLQGACDITNCSLSHNVTLEKMPTCKFFLDGFCSKEKCSYLHVKLSKRVEICKDFLKGFCQAADKCEKRHEYLCPDFDKSGCCSKPKCTYNHNQGSLGKTGICNSINTQMKLDNNINIQTDNEVKNSHEKTEINNYRYYTNDSDLNSDNTSKSSSIFKTSVKNNEDCPDFIPFS